MQRRKILVVDDEDSIRELVQICLEDLGGWDTIAARSGEECLEILETEQPSAILLDVSMPVMDGVTLYQHLQSNPKTRKIPVVLLTAKTLPSDRAKFAQIGVTGVMFKPIRPLTLTEELAKILGWDEQNRRGL